MKIPSAFCATVIAAASTAIACGLILVIGFAIRAVCAQSQMQLAQSKPDSKVAPGRKIFALHCAECHGLDARGEDGPSLYGLRSSDRLRRQIISGGIRKEMPAYGRVLTPIEMDDLLAYLGTLKGYKRSYHEAARHR